MDGSKLFQLETDRCRALRALARRAVPRAPDERHRGVRLRLAASLVAALLLVSGIALAMVA